MGDNEILVNFRMVQASSGEGEGGRVGRHTDTQTDRHTHRHINTLTRPGVKAGRVKNKGVWILHSFESKLDQETWLC